uniref:Protein-serine/threonine kinase n=2 Tax=Moniliophthora roreri TaxID=221103 RepID=A0A0W0G818_MONRR
MLTRPSTTLTSRWAILTTTGPYKQHYYRRAPSPKSAQLTELLEKYASSPQRPMNLSDLLAFGRPTVTPESVLASVSYALAEIPRRLATRVRSLEALPFIVGTNPYIANTLAADKDSFLWLATYPTPTTLDENALFAAELEDVVGRHANDIPTMAKGFQECSKYLSPSQINEFLDGAIRNRLSVRLIAEQHVALSHAINSSERSNIGIVDMQCSPAQMIKMCGNFVTELCEATLGASPSIVIDGHADAKFAYVPVHMEYILTEILKNSFRATVEHHSRHSTKELPPIIITLSPSPKLSGDPSSCFSLRIRDQGGGVSPSNIEKIFSYAFTTAGRAADGSALDEDNGGPYAAQYVGGSAAIGDGGIGEGNLFAEITGKGLQTGLGTIAGLGYGLPMSRLYAKQVWVLFLAPDFSFHD